MDFFELQLGQKMEGKTLYITIKLEMVLSTGKVCQF